MTKKNAILILVIILTIAVGVVLYFTFFASEKDATKGEVTTPSEQTFFPINNTGRENDQSEEFEPVENPLNKFNIPRLRQIANVPVAGFTVFERIATTSNILTEGENEEEEESIEETTETVYRYMERATGHIYETTSRSLDVKRISNTTIPKIYNAEFSKDGESVVLQYLNREDQIETFVANLVDPEPIEVVTSDATSTSTPAATSTVDEIILPDEFQKLDGNFLPTNVIGFDKSPNQDDIFYLLEELNSGFIPRGLGYITSFTDTKTQKSILDSPASEWQVTWPNENIITLNNNPSAEANGFLYFLNINNGAFTKILGGFSGFNSLTNPDLSKILYTRNISGNPSLFIYDMEEKESFDLVLSTFIEKCAWAKENTETAYCALPNDFPTGNYPDQWYQGVTSFTDSLAKISWEENIIEDVPGLTIPFDIIKPELSEKDDYFVFINKKDLTLWSLDLSI